MKDITLKSKNLVKLMNKDNIYKAIKVYELNDNKIFHSVTKDDKLHLSISTPSGPPHLKTAVSIFTLFSNDDLTGYKILRSEKALHFIKRDSQMFS